MPSISLFLVGTQGHWVAQAPSPGSLAELSGFLLVLLTTALIIAAVERVGRR